ncbi:uncharacterized protein LOC106646484, partial [Copidosoma floridanum]|uniref:uncharacterized protein LOC106646484 n=1 Tax=Copidosoma floridanum TaxID=29053 RepID=UPI0006C97342
NSITKQMMIIEITSRLNNASVLPSNDRMQLLVVVRAMVDDMNLDCDDPTLISYRCAKCKRLVSDEKESCMNLECPFGSGIKSPINITSINVLVNLKDDTGYLVGCRLRDAAAEEAFSCSADIMRGMTREQLKNLKNKYCKKLCNVRMQVIGPSTNFQSAIYIILAINVIESEDDNYEPLNVDELDLNSYE